MDNLAVTKATFADFRIIKTRKTAQLILELPIENADAALIALGGLPRSDAERWVAIARLNDIDQIRKEKAHRAFHELPFPQQAALKSKDETFQSWINGGYPSEQGCAVAIRNHCGVNSRADILQGTEAGERWLGLLREFEGVR
jgi:hypothetical protein